MTGRDYDRLILTDRALLDDWRRDDGGDVSTGAPTLLCQTYQKTLYPTTANVFFACMPLDILGTEVEGGPGVLTSTEATIFALNLGTAVPPQGTVVVCSFCADRWCFRYDG